MKTVSLAQDSPDKTAADKAAARNREAQESSSHDTRIDISPPKDDAKNHPASKDAIAGLGITDTSDNPDTSGIQEFHPWNPLKALKDIEVGDYYFKRNR